MSWTREKKRAHHAKLRAQGTSDNARDRHGCICTLRVEASGERVSLHRSGLRLDALRAVVEWCDATPGDWRLVAYSTPQTIAGDLADRRTFENGGRGGRKGERGNVTIAYPEVAMLGRIGRADLIAPELLARVDENERLRRRQRTGLE